MSEAAERAEREAVDDAVFDRGAAGLREEDVTVLPARIGAADLDVEEAKRRIVFAHVRAPAQRDTTPPETQVERGARGHRRRRSEQAKPERRRSDTHEVGGIGEEGEHFGTRLREPHPRLHDVVGHGATAKRLPWRACGVKAREGRPAEQTPAWGPSRSGPTACG